MTEEQAFTVKPLVLAYLGDGVYDLYIRSRLIEGKYRDAHDLHVKKIRFVNAAAQAYIIRELDERLTGRERDVTRYGRNAHSNTVPKNANVTDYHAATGFEALLGYLKLSEQEERLDQILELSYELIVKRENDG
jgi:ribonuclease-3 family protein